MLARAAAISIVGTLLFLLVLLDERAEEMEPPRRSHRRQRVGGSLLEACNRWSLTILDGRQLHALDRLARPRAR